MLKEYLAYIKDNPENYWFRAKLYGWGWTPVRWQGWATIGLYVLAVAIIVLTLGDKNSSDGEASLKVLLPILILTSILLYICHKTGEKPRWQWGMPDKYKQEK
mgnify:CR=1 FL=1